MAGYSKLFAEIVTSSIWSESHTTRIVWVTILALKDRDGFVPAALPGLAAMARVSVEECAEAVAKLEAPDQHSRSKDHDGRRIEHVDGGWIVLNHFRYRDDLSTDPEAVAARERQRRHREKLMGRDKGVTGRDCHVTDRDKGVTHCDTASASASLNLVSFPVEEKAVAGPPGIGELTTQVMACRPEFGALNRMAVENTVKDVQLSAARLGVADFCRDMANALKVPDMPLKVLRGYLATAASGKRKPHPAGSATPTPRAPTYREIVENCFDQIWEAKQNGGDVARAMSACRDKWGQRNGDYIADAMDIIKFRICDSIRAVTIRKEKDNEQTGYSKTGRRDSEGRD